MAKKKSAGAGQHRRPAGKRLGLKVSSGEKDIRKIYYDIF